jgi:hypothetical protein
VLPHRARAGSRANPQLAGIEAAATAAGMAFEGRAHIADDGRPSLPAMAAAGG